MIYLIYLIYLSGVWNISHWRGSPTKELRTQSLYILVCICVRCVLHVPGKYLQAQIYILIYCIRCVLHGSIFKPKLYVLVYCIRCRIAWQYLQAHFSQARSLRKFEVLHFPTGRSSCVKYLCLTCLPQEAPVVASLAFPRMNSTQQAVQARRRGITVFYGTTVRARSINTSVCYTTVSYTHLTLPTIYSV